MSIKSYITLSDEDIVNVFMWIVDKAIHHDAFSKQEGLLRDYKQKLVRAKVTIVNGGMMNNNKQHQHYNKGNNLKMR